MGTIHHTQENTRLQVSTDLGKDRLILVRVHGVEYISDLFHYSLEMFSEECDLDFAGIVNTAATVSLSLQGGTERTISGVVARFVQSGQDGRGLTTYHAELRPWLWLLTQASDCRIFQQLSAPEIVDAVFQDLGFVADTHYRWDLKGSYDKREYCVQYKETAFNFVSRLMEEEGIFYFFTHEEGRHVLVMADDADAHQACPGLDSFSIQKTQVAQPAEDDLVQFTVEENVIPRTYAMKDYDFAKPSTNLAVKADGQVGKTEVYEYHGGYRLKGAGEKRASRRLESFEWAQRLVSGSGWCRAFGAGHKFKLKEHARADVNGEWVLERVSLSATREEYSNSFRAFPAKLTYRPPQRAVKPRVTGSETAVVTGKSGEEIFADQQGRIKVQFHWDRYGEMDENSSCWVRVAQPWGGKGWGSLVVPRIGQEVVVHYMDGDPDRPLVVGSVYNGDNPPPYDLSATPTMSGLKSNSSKGGGGFNELRFDDKKGSEVLYLQAEKDKKVLVKHDRSEEVLNDETIAIGHDRSETVTNDEKVAIGKNRTAEVGVDEAVTVGANRKETIGANRTEVVGANHSETIGANKVVQVAANLTEAVGGAMSVSVAGAMNETVGGAKVASVGGASAENVAAAKALSVGGAYAINVGGLMNTAVAIANLEQVGLIKKVVVGMSHSTSAKKVTISASDQIELKAGAASIVIKSSGEIEIRGTKVVTQAAVLVDVKAALIKLNS